MVAGCDRRVRRRGGGVLVAENIIQFQQGREAAMCGGARDGRRCADWLEGYDSEADALNLPVWGNLSASTGKTTHGLG
jgi:hypothetical protein